MKSPEFKYLKRLGCKIPKDAVIKTQYHRFECNYNNAKTTYSQNLQADKLEPMFYQANKTTPQKIQSGNPRKKSKISAKLVRHHP